VKISRRNALGLLGAPLIWKPGPATAAPANSEPFPVRYRKRASWEEAAALADPARDIFGCEVRAQRLNVLLTEGFRRRSLPLASEWLDSLGEIRRAQFWPLPNDAVRFEIASAVSGELRYRVGLWRVRLSGDHIQSIETLEESTAASPQPLFEEISANLFGGISSWRHQLSKGIPYWRSRLDSSVGIDVFGNCGLAVGDADGDGADEIYVCQPSGLPNLLYRRGSGGAWEDVTEAAGVGVLDGTASALFLDLRNIGRQDLLVLTTSTPLLFLNEGGGRFRHAPEAFRFAQPPRGSLSGMAATDYDRDGRLDLYLCVSLQ
jgi:hypothetical protein